MKITNQKYLIKNSESLFIVLLWIVLILSPIVFHAFTNNLTVQNILLPMQVMVPLFVLFLVNRFILVPFILFRRKQVNYIISVVLLISLLMTGVYFFHVGYFREPARTEMPGRPRPQPAPGPIRNNPDRLDGREKPDDPKPLPPYLNFLIFSILLVGFDTGLKVTFSYFRTEQEKSRLEQENIRNQLAFLRNQVSPHFFLNTLNNIHSLIDLDAEEAKTSIIKLSKLMRHLLYDSNADTTSLKKEMEFIISYINLMKLRFPEKVKIQVQIPEYLPDKQIPPLIFTSLIENAFKHGISYNSNSFVMLSVKFEDDRMLFEIENSNPHFKGSREHEGIGLENTRKRLDLLFKNNYSLEISENEEAFSVKLNLPL